MSDGELLWAVIQYQLGRIHGAKNGDLVVWKNNEGVCLRLYLSGSGFGFCASVAPLNHDGPGRVGLPSKFKVPAVLIIEYYRTNEILPTYGVEP